ncbi:MAG: 1-acyl-sn-glycerol-3-phosphate acyltransferase, partial [Propionivibrio sp.]|nr:1-acyl-sn-glycerol-3-phosphate acyltransferase [Propionivibrio sp.]
MHLLWGALTIACTYRFLNDPCRLWLKQRWSRQLLEILAIRLDAGIGGAAHGSLIVANHISWLDIFVLNAARPMAFVSKSEVRHWPLAGWLAAN